MVYRQNQLPLWTHSLAELEQPRLTGQPLHLFPNQLLPDEP